jgi:hypothetical protein
MSKQFSQDEIKNNEYFWYSYISCYRGYDDIKEINMDEALEVIELDKKKLASWQAVNFSNINNESKVRYIGGKLNKNISFLIEFQEQEILFYINDIYIGNLGGHFEAWFFTWDELLAFQAFESLFLLLLPMAAIETQQINEAEIIIAKHLKTIPKFENNAAYIAKCILNGISIATPFYNKNEIGIVNSQNHSIRNIDKHPQHKADVIKLNRSLRKFTEK